MPMLTTNDDVRLHYVDEGPSDAPVLLMIPGWGCSTQWFQAQISGLSGRFRVIAYDPRGQGRSQRTGAGQRMSRVAKDLDDVLTELGLREVVVLGWSLGASTVLSYVDMFGCAALRGVVLVGGGPRLVNSDGWELGYIGSDEVPGWVATMRWDLETAADFLLPRFFTTEPPQLADLRADITGMHNEAAAAMSYNVLTEDYTDVLGKVRVPALVVTGSRDAVIPAGNAPFMAERLPRARAVEIAEAGHAPFLERPVEFNRVLADFAG